MHKMCIKIGERKHVYCMLLFIDIRKVIIFTGFSRGVTVRCLYVKCLVIVSITVANKHTFLKDFKICYMISKNIIFKKII